MNLAVLIVDDSLTVRMDLEEAFAASGFRTQLCADVVAARRALAGGVFDVVILDVVMPGDDGLALLRELRQAATTASLPIILLSTEAEVSDRIRGFETGATDYVSKPYDRAYLVARARELVRRSRRNAPDHSARLVLLIDGSATARQSLGRALEAEGFVVLEASSGEEGLKLAFDRRPAAAIIDAALPGMDGASVVRQLRGDSVLRRTACVVLTAVDGPVGELEALEGGADAYVRKDERLAIVLTRLRALLRSRPAGQPPVEAPSVLGPKRILAVDDSPTYLQEVTEQLSHDGFEVVQACSAEDALRLLSVQEVDCVLMDQMMPGLSGREACQTIKADPHHRHVPLIIVTAREEPEEMIQAIEAGADDFVAKSSHFQVLRARVRAQLRRKQFEHESRVLADHARFEHAAEILETIPDAFCAMDREGRIVFANGPALELAGLRREESVGASLWKALGKIASPSLQHRIELALIQHEPCRFVERFPGMGEPTYEVRAFPREHDLILYLRDVTERVKAEEALREADRRKDEFLGLLSHELRNPLAPIRNSLHILDRAAPASEQARRAREVIGRQIGQLVRLVDDLLDITRIARGKIQLRKGRLELGDLVRRAVEDHRSLLAENGVAVEAQIASGCWVDGDATRLAQVVGNLLQNSAKFTSRGDRVTVTLEAGPADDAVLRVRDTGSGIDPMFLTRLFEPFVQGEPRQTRNQGGLGLGLALVKGLVEEHGGAVRAASAGPGKGSEFTITLPLDREERVEPVPAPTPAWRNTRGGRVLIIDDNIDEADSLREALDLNGYETEAAYGAADGLEKARAFRPDVIFCDIGMPVMDGYEFARSVRANPALAATHLVALTGYGRVEDVARAREAGFDHHMAKPASITDLERTISRSGITNRD